jgi:NTE family protein
MPKKQINLALQGGGSHGAYTWGVLDRLLDEEDIEISGISGTSAGAMNGAVMAYAYRHGGAPAAKAKLEEFWRRVSELGTFMTSPYQAQLQRYTMGWNIDDTPAYQWMDMLTHMFSPYQLNPFNINPLRNLLSELVDWEKFNEGGEMPLFVTATSVRTGQPRVFRCEEINEDVLMASACLPFNFQSVEVGGEPYWDGGYMGNPSIWPLVYYTEVSDALLVQINPIVRDGVPKTAHQIMNRLNEITFNSSLIAEMRAINFVSKLIHDHNLNIPDYKEVRMHMIEAPDAALNLNASSKSNADWNFLKMLRDAGRIKAEEWIAKNKQFIGIKPTINIEKEFLSRQKPPEESGKPAPPQ